VAVSNAFSTNVVRLSSTADVCYQVGATPVAIGGTSAGADNFLPANTVEYIKVKAGTDKIAVIAQDETSAGGVFYVGEYH
jgi:hypothetical protein